MADEAIGCAAYQPRTRQCCWELMLQAGRESFGVTLEPGTNVRPSKP